MRIKSASPGWYKSLGIKFASIGEADLGPFYDKLQIARCQLRMFHLTRNNQK